MKKTKLRLHIDQAGINCTSRLFLLHIFFLRPKKFCNFITESFPNSRESHGIERVKLLRFLGQNLLLKSHIFLFYTSQIVFFFFFNLGFTNLHPVMSGQSVRYLFRGHLEKQSNLMIGNICDSFLVFMYYMRS